MLSLLLAHTAVAATPLVGVEYAPLSRADLAWVSEERTSGLAVGELDGTVAPTLSAFGGAWLGPHWGLVGSLAVARLASSSSTDDVERERLWCVIRPALDVRFGFGPRSVGHASPWLFVGFHGDIPVVKDESNAYTDEEAAAAEDNERFERQRLGGGGGRFGLGVDYRITGAVVIGLRHAIEGHWGMLRTEESTEYSSWIRSETAFLLTFEWPKPVE